MENKNLQLLKENLIQFKKITETIVSCIENENIEDIDMYLQKKQEVIANIQQLNYTHKDFSAICEELNILNCQENLNKVVESKKNELKAEMIKIKEKNTANKSYVKNSMINRNFFNTKI